MVNEKEKFSTRVIKNSTIASAGGLVAKLVGLGSTLITIHFLNLYEYGLYKLILAAFGLLSSFLFAGIDQIFLADAAVERGRNNIGRVKRYIVEYFAVKAILGVALWVAVFFGAGIAGNFYGADIARYLKIISFLFLLNPFRALINLLFRLDLKFFSASSIGILEEISKFALLLYFFFVAGFSIDGVILAYTISSFISVIIMLYFAIPALKEFREIKIDSSFVFWDIIKGHGKWGILTSYSMDIQSNLQPWLIKFFINTEAVAVVSVAQSLVNHAASLFRMSDVLAPTIPREINDKDRFRRIFFRGIKYGTLVFTCIAVGAFVFAPYFLQFFFPKYTSSLPVFKIIIATLVFAGMANMLSSVFYAFKMQKDLFVDALWRFVFMVIASIILFPLTGIVGVGIQVVLTFVFFVYMRYRSVIKAIPELAFNFSDLLKFDSYDKQLLNRLKTYSFKFLKINSDK